MKLNILKGWHYSNFFPRVFLFKQPFTKSVTVKFDRSCMYSIDEKSCVNKLWGFSVGLFGVHQNSFRFGWTYNQELDTIDIWSYAYLSGRLYKKRMGSCEFNKEYTFTIVLNDKVTLYFDDHIAEFQLIEWRPLLLELGFYFGGNTKAPHKMNIEFNKD